MGSLPYAHGWDLARHEGYTIGVVLDTAGDLVAFERMNETSWAQIQRLIESTHAEYPGPVAVDASRENRLVVDLEQSRLPIEPAKFSLPRKTDLVESLAVALEQGELAAPEIPPLRQELEPFEYEVTPFRNTRYHAHEKFYDDCVDSLSLAVNA
jgi:hypothetical protein